MSMRQGEEVKTPDDLPDPFEHKSIFKRFDLEVDHIKEGSFTESDKRKVMESFLSNEEVQYFIYCLLFPQGGIKEEGEEVVKQES